MVQCPICGEDGATPWRVVDDYAYLECGRCDSIFIDPVVIAEIDAGASIVDYSGDYWERERSAAHERSFGSSLARVAEVLLYARRPVRRFLDIGSGPGFLLDALSAYLPASRQVFHGVELFPPRETTSHPNFVRGAIADLHGRFDAGCCIEVVEHLTPTMLRGMLEQLAGRSEPGAIYIFNTGLPEYVKGEDPGYMDPKRRGHIVSYGLKGMAHIAASLGFACLPIVGKPWAFCLEYLPEEGLPPLQPRIWSPRPENRALLHDREMGSALYVLALETARAYG